MIWDGQRWTAPRSDQRLSGSRCWNKFRWRIITLSEQAFVVITRNLPWSLHQWACPEACPKMLLFGVSVQGSCLGSPVGLLFEPLLKVIPNSIPDLVLKTRQGSRSWPEARQHDVKRCHPPIPTYCHPAVFLCGSRSSHPSRPFDMNALLQTSVKIIPRILGKWSYETG